MSSLMEEYGAAQESADDLYSRLTRINPQHKLLKITPNSVEFGTLYYTEGELEIRNSYLINPDSIDPQTIKDYLWIQITAYGKYINDLENAIKLEERLKTV